MEHSSDGDGRDGAEAARGEKRQLGVEVGGDQAR
jgi:hypothetical protein